MSMLQSNEANKFDSMKNKIFYQNVKATKSGK